MLPRIHTQQRLQHNRPLRHQRLIPTPRPKHPRLQTRIHILFLLPIMRPRQRTARNKRRQDREFRPGLQVAVVVVAFDEPDEAGAEHGVCGCEEGRAEGFDAGEGGGEFFFEGGGDGGGGGGEG